MNVLLPTAPAATPAVAPEEPSGWSRLADAGLWAVACSGFALSYSSVQRAALQHVDHEWLSYLVPAVADGAALAAAARYVADRRAGLPGRGWQLLAWAAIGASCLLNAMGRSVGDAVWHLVGPGALAVITELYARRAAQLRLQEQPERAEESIPVRLWLTAPLLSVRVWLWMARTGQRSMIEATRSMGRHAAALEALGAACGGFRYRRMRRVARRQLRAGTLPPAAVLRVLGWTGGTAVPADPPAALQALLAVALLQDAHPAIQPAAVPVAVQPVELETQSTPPVVPVPPVVPEPEPEDIPPVMPETADRARAVRSSRTDEEIAGQVRAAIAAGRLQADPSPEAVRLELGIGWPRAVRVLEAMTQAAWQEIQPALPLDLSQPAPQPAPQAGLEPGAVQELAPEQAPQRSAQRDLPQLVGAV